MFTLSCHLADPDWEIVNGAENNRGPGDALETQCTRTALNLSM